MGPNSKARPVIILVVVPGVIQIRWDPFSIHRNCGDVRHSPPEAARWDPAGPIGSTGNTSACRILDPHPCIHPDGRAIRFDGLRQVGHICRAGPGPEPQLGCPIYRTKIDGRSGKIPMALSRFRPRFQVCTPPLTRPDTWALRWHPAARPMSRRIL